MRIDSVLYRGFVDKDLRVTYIYNFESYGKFPTIIQKDNGNVVIYPAYALSISEGFDKPHVYIPTNKYHSFVSLLEKCIKLVSDNLYDIFPNVNKIEFETDSRVLERFQTEQALSTNGITMIPAVWTDGSGSCFPGIQINMMNGSITIPFEDVISIGQMLKTFEPNQFGLSILRIIGKID